MQTRKCCRITAAHIQGLPANLAHFAMGGNLEEPIVFDGGKRVDLQWAIRKYCTPAMLAEAKALGVGLRLGPANLSRAQPDSPKIGSPHSNGKDNLAIVGEEQVGSQRAAADAINAHISNTCLAVPPGLGLHSQTEGIEQDRITRGPSTAERRIRSPPGLSRSDNAVGNDLVMAARPHGPFHDLQQQQQKQQIEPPLEAHRVNVSDGPLIEPVVEDDWAAAAAAAMEKRWQHLQQQQQHEQQQHEQLQLQQQLQQLQRKMLAREEQQWQQRQQQRQQRESTELLEQHMDLDGLNFEDYIGDAIDIYRHDFPDKAILFDDLAEQNIQIENNEIQRVGGRMSGLSPMDQYHHASHQF